ERHGDDVRGVRPAGGGTRRSGGSCAGLGGRRLDGPGHGDGCQGYPPCRFRRGPTAGSGSDPVDRGVARRRDGDGPGGGPRCPAGAHAGPHRLRRDRLGAAGGAGPPRPRRRDAERDAGRRAANRRVAGRARGRRRGTPGHRQPARWWLCDADDGPQPDGRHRARPDRRRPGARQGRRRVRRPPAV
ncbi:MAG: Predicted L-lactate dehydrogenase, hypothetical protein subunit YkgG, partial [uncultured Thermomicrobiales bacterium]